MMKHTLFNSVKNNTGRNADKPWPEFVKDHLLDHQIISQKDAGLMYSGAVYEMDPPKRGDANVASMSMMIVDYDNSQGIGNDAKCSGLPTMPEDVDAELAGITNAFHSTHSNAAKWPRWRLVIPFNRLVTRTEWPVVFAYVYETMLGSDENIDTSCRDLSRAYWGPACSSGTENVAFSGYNEGELLNIDDIMDEMRTTVSPEFLAAVADNVVALTTPTQPTKPLDQPSTPNGRNDYLKQVVAAMLERQEPLEEIICQVYQADIDKHGSNALFSDVAEGMRGSPPINAMGFVTNVIRSIDSMRTRAAIEPQIPAMRPVNPVEGFLMPAEEKAEPLEMVSAASLRNHVVKPVEWVMDGWMPRGQTTAFYGDGGIGKTMLIQQLMTCVSTGSPFFGKATIPGPVMGLFAEDDTNQLLVRQRKINGMYGTDLAAQDDIKYMPRPAHDNVLMEFDKNSSDGKLTPLWHQLRAHIMEVRPVMLVVDTAADTFGGIEIDRQQVRRYIQGALTSLAIEFNLAVVLLAHPSAAGLSSGQGTGGSTAWNNTPRARVFMYKNPEKGCITFKLMKNNYGPVGEEIDVYHNGEGFVPWGKTETLGYVDELKARENVKWVKEMIHECWAKKINISFHPRANYVASQLMKMAKMEQYNITKSAIEDIANDLHKAGTLEVLDRGHGKSSGSTMRILGA